MKSHIHMCTRTHKGTRVYIERKACKRTGGNGKIGMKLYNSKDLPVLHSTAVKSEFIHGPVVDAIRTSPVECGILCAAYYRLKIKPLW